MKKSEHHTNTPSANVQAIIDKGMPWTDPDFPPNQNSLSPNGTFKFEWKRVGDIMKNPVVFDKDINADDINQGALGDCYFLCALSALAEFPDRVRAIFKTQSTNVAGIYEVEFCIGGRQTSVIIDDWIPINKQGKPAFCQTFENELWAIFLEKAFAKLHANYDVMQGGKSGMALHLLTGFPDTDYLHGNLEQL